MLLAFFCLMGACACSGSGSFPKPLSSQEEQKTLESYFQGTEKEKAEAKERLILHNLRLVAHIAKKIYHFSKRYGRNDLHRNSGVDQSDSNL